ncbi:MAG TPA: HAMP domain-containing sensor histidine kinase [Thermodesulfobacteriota bacterium]|nr:HAMP domain-containing sensor histidine kinase [Thermodesulfobacteriota bacterium]
MNKKYWLFFVGILVVFNLLLFFLPRDWIIYGVPLFVFLILPAVIQGNWVDFLLTSIISTLAGVYLLNLRGFDNVGAIFPFLVMLGVGAIIKGFLIFQRERQKIDEKEINILYRFAGEISHEVRNPLATIKSALKLIQSDKGKEEQKKELVEIALNELSRIEEIMNKFSSWTKLEQIEKRKIDLNILIEEVLTGFNQNEKVNIQIVSDSDAPLFIRGDRTVLYMALTNIIRNAFESMSDGGVLKVHLSRQGTKAQILISDTGSGIRPEDLPHIFEPFFSRKNGNSGLGLPIALRAIEAHGGDIKVKSTFGKGATFSVQIPAEG